MQKPQINTYVLGKLLKEIEIILMNRGVSDIKTSAIAAHITILAEEASGHEDFIESFLDYVVDEPDMTGSYRLLSEILYP